MADIPLSLHEPLVGAHSDGGDAPAGIEIQLDRDSSVSPKPWVSLSFTDEHNDAVTIRLNAQEAMQLSRRLSDLGSVIL